MCFCAHLSARASTCIENSSARVFFFFLFNAAASLSIAFGATRFQSWPPSSDENDALASAVYNARALFYKKLFFAVRTKIIFSYFGALRDDGDAAQNSGAILSCTRARARALACVYVAFFSSCLSRKQARPRYMLKHARHSLARAARSRASRVFARARARARVSLASPIHTLMSESFPARTSLLFVLSKDDS